MATKSLVGIDVGHDQLKLAWVKGGSIKKMVTVKMPENLYKDGHIVSEETMNGLVRTALKENGITEKKAALLISSGSAYIRNITMPLMNAEQLMYNLPFEFRDYFTEELHEYMYDYAMYTTPEELKAMEGEPVMSLLGVAVKKELILEMRELINKCGMDAEVISPTLTAYRNIIAEHEKSLGAKDEEYCFLDMGHKTIRMNIFKSTRHVASREIENAVESIDETVAGIFNVDRHLAHTYLLSNFQDCQNNEACLETYSSIAVEIMRALNFYQFSNPDSHLANIYVSGGGSYIRPLINTLASTMSDYSVLQASTLLNNASEEANGQLLAIGIAMTNI